MEVLLRGPLGTQVGLDLGAPASRSAFEDVRVMEQPIELNIQEIVIRPPVSTKA